MATHRLIITIDYDEVSDDAAITEAFEDLRIFKQEFSSLVEQTSFKLIREGDRSALNILLPKLQGRMGEHFQGRKATFKDFDK